MRTLDRGSNKHYPFHCRDLKNKQRDLRDKMQPDKTAIQNLRSAKGDLDKKKKSKENEVKDIEKEEKQLKGELKDIEKHRSDLEGVVSKASTIPIILIAIYSFIASVYFSCYSCYVFTYSGIPGHWATREMSICWIYGRLPCHSRFHSSPQDQPVWLICDNAKVVSIIKNMEALGLMINQLRS